MIPPWDAAVRVRLGKTAVLLKPGLNLRVPTIDEITLVNTRLRICSVPAMTLPGSAPTKTRTIDVSIGFRVTDPLRCMMAYTMPEPALCAFVQSKIARSAAFEQSECERELQLEFARNGIDVEFVYATSNVEVRTFRLIQGGSGAGALWSGPTGICGPSAPGSIPIATY